MAEVKKENWFKRTWGKTCKFFRELRSELKKVVWPTMEQVLKNALVVACCVLVVGAFIWLFDYVAQVGINGLISLVHNH
ncbi:MAG: preprotein translocase subunit SecE [Oscillospiraceae bacterium]|nr:preprotein translocase subunit SecE [Oscillospiraceae bacterium]